MDPLTIGLTASSLLSAGGMLSGLGSSKSATKRANRQAALYGKVAKRYSDELSELYAELKDEYSAEADLSGWEEDLQKYVTSLEQGGTADAYERLAKDAWNKSFQALSEIPGMTSGQRLAAMSTLTSQYGTAMTEAGIRGEEERVNRAGQIYSAEQGFDTAEINEQLRQITQAQSYGNLGLDTLKTRAQLRLTNTVQSQPQQNDYMQQIYSQLTQLGMMGVGYGLGGMMTPKRTTTTGSTNVSGSSNNPYGNLASPWSPYNYREDLT